MKKWGLMLAASMSVLALASCGDPAGTDGASSGGGSPSADGEPGVALEGSRLQTVLDRGELICGVEGAIPGFSFVDENGDYSGLDVDVCRAVAAALFDDPDSVTYINLTSNARFEALNSGEVDMLSRNTTWTTGRDTAIGLEFAPTTFYDAQGMMVREADGITELADLDGRTVCVEAGTSTELNLATAMEQEGINFNVEVFDDANVAYSTYEEESCDAMTSDKSQLLARRTQLSDPSAHVLLDVSMSKEPLGPVTINNDSAWFDAVKWITFALIQAEEFGLTADNVEAAVDSDNPNIQRFLGATDSLGADMGLSNDFALRAIKHVGNYGEIYDRNLGEGSENNLPRGLNDLWTNGGLLYSPPFL